MRDFAQAPSAESTTPGNGSTFSFGAFAAILVCAAAFLGSGASAASAAPKAAPAWAYKFTFGSEGHGISDTVRTEIALDSSGNIFAQQTFQTYVAVYKPSATEGGEFLTEVAGGQILTNIAIDQSTDALYAYESLFYNGENARMKRWLSDGQPTPSYTLDPSFEIAEGDGFGIDPSTGDILVTDPGAEGVHRYDDTGALVETIATPSIAPSWILPMADGSFYVASAAGPDLTHFSGSGTLLGTIAGVGQLRGLAYDPVRELIVASVGDQLKSYSLAGVLRSSSPSKGGGAGTVVAPTGLLYEENTTGSVNVYSAAAQPAVEAPIVSEVTGHSAHIEAEVEPGEEGGPGEAPPGSKAHFEYSDDGGQHWKELPDNELNAAGVAKIEADLTGLLPNLEYQVRVVAENSAGLEATSSAVSFSTLEVAPDVETGAATGLGETGATLNGTVNPNGLQTTYHFEYGTTTSYGSRVPVPVDAVAGNQRVNRSFSNSISGLAPETIYHYRLVAANAFGESVGDDRTFTTAGAGEAAPARAYELVTPVDKDGALISSDPFHSQASEDGSAIAVNVVSGPEGSVSAPIRQHYVASRGPDGWSNWVASDAPLAAEAGVFETSTLAISKDFTKAFVVSNRVLAPGAIAGGGNLYVKDLQTGSYAFVGGAPGVNAYRLLAGPSVSEGVFAAAAPDFSWIVFWSEAPLEVPSAPGIQGRQLYRWTPEEGITLESRLPDGSIPPSPVFSVSPVVDGKIELPLASADGSLVAFDLNYFGAGGVYLRENGQSTPISLSRRVGDDPTVVHSGTVDWVTPSGRYVFFHCAHPLTEETPADLSGLNAMYRYDTQTDELTFLDKTLPGATTQPFYGAAEDGETAYFAGDGVSVVWHDGILHTVTGGYLFNFGNYVTDNGRYLAWMGGDQEVHLYDRDSAETICVSCLSGASSAGKAHMVSGSRGLANRAPRAVLKNGTVFFDTPNALLPADHNSMQDVYSYRNGHFALISPGDADVGAIFVDASEDGTDVYFLTAQGIVPEDTNGSTDVYDARIGGGFSQPPIKPDCSGEGCRGPNGAAPQGPPIGSAGSGQNAGAPISSVKRLKPAELAKLAEGRTAHLKVRVNRPGKVQVVGTASVGQVIKASQQAKQAGPVTVPIRLSKKGLRQLDLRGSLVIRLSVSLGGEGQKAPPFTLKAAGGKKGGAS